MALGSKRREGESNGRKGMRGKLWPNTRRSGPKAPDYTGVATIDGRDYRVALWEETRDDTLSLAFKDKTEDRRDAYDRREAHARAQAPSGDEPEPSRDAHSPTPAPDARADWDRGTEEPPPF